LSKEEARAAAIPVFDEELRVKKTIKETDRVFIRISALERTEVADLELRSGEAIIERVPVDRMLEAAPAIRHDGDTIIVPVVEEIMVIARTTDPRTVRAMATSRTLTHDAWHYHLLDFQ
jgi:stress response protein YsnF